MYAFWTIGDHGAKLIGWQCLLAWTSILVRISSTSSSSLRSADDKWGLAVKSAMQCERLCFWQHWIISLQKFWACYSWLLLRPRIMPVAGEVGVFLKRMSGLKSMPNKWSPLIRGGIPKGRIHARVSASANSVVPVMTSIGELPHWNVASLRCVG